MPRGKHTPETPKPRHSKAVCSKCSEPGFRYRGDRWLCVVHNRMDTMRECARGKGKSVPSFAILGLLIESLIRNGMKCPHCKQDVVWAKGEGGLNNVISLQHDRDGTIRLICMLCNQRHDDFPGDLFYGEVAHANH